MKAILFTYTTEGLSKTEASKISKEITGYKDNSNKGKYNYKREGIIQDCNGIVVSKSTFIIPATQEKMINKLKKKGLKIRKWEINLSKSYFFSKSSTQQIKRKIFKSYSFSLVK